MIVTKAECVTVGKESLYDFNITDEYSLLEANSSINKQIDKISVYVQGVEALDYMSRYVSNSMEKQQPIVTEYINDNMAFISELTKIKSDEYILDGTESLSAVFSNISSFISKMFNSIIDMISGMIKYVVELVKKVIDFILDLFRSKKSSGGGGSSSGSRPSAKEKVEKTIEEVKDAIEKKRDEYNSNPNAYKKFAKKESDEIIDRIHTALEKLPLGVMAGTFDDGISMNTLSVYTRNLSNSYDDIFNVLQNVSEYNLFKLSMDGRTNDENTFSSILLKQMNNLVDNVNKLDQRDRESNMLFINNGSDMKNLFDDVFNYIKYVPSTDNSSIDFFKNIGDKFSDLLDEYNGTIIGFTNKYIILRTFDEEAVEEAKTGYLDAIKEIQYRMSLDEDDDESLTINSMLNLYIKAVGHIANSISSKIVKITVPIDDDISDKIKKLDVKLEKDKMFIRDLVTNRESLFSEDKVEKDIGTLDDLSNNIEKILGIEKKNIAEIKDKFDKTNKKITEGNDNIKTFNTVVTKYISIINKEVTESVTNYKDLVIAIKDILTEITDDTEHKHNISKLEGYLIDYQVVNSVIKH